MGAYVEVPDLPFGKYEWLIEYAGAIPILANDPIPDDSLKVCVVTNEAFEAALICVDDRELARTMRPDDDRLRRYLAMKTSVLEQISDGYRRYVDRQPSADHKP